jgi:hypothetical protein
MVRLDGEWYCVDVTWNDPIDAPRPPIPELHHWFFNVTSEFLKENDHQWDETAFPEATATRYAWAG